MMQPLYLLLGSNVENRANYLHQATLLIDKYLGSIVMQSSVYETIPWGYSQQAHFLNQVVMLWSDSSPLEVLATAKSIEKQVGRTYSMKWGPREIDIDILLYGDLVVESAALVIPHPYLPQRKFALYPLCEIAPQQIHPVLHKTVKELLKACADVSPVKKIDALV